MPEPIRAIRLILATASRLSFFENFENRRCSTQRAGIEPPHPEGERVSGVTRDRETFAFISVPAGVAGGVPLTRARNPWVPEASA